MLAAGERAGVDIAVDFDDEAYAWIIERYRSLMVDRSFHGVPVAVLDGLRALRRDPAEVLVYRAGHQRSWHAGLIVARHGTTATYAVGWSDDEGRRRRSMNVLLFEAMLDTARRGGRWFDLGGIDDVLTPGVARFKRGVNGEEYTLAGEFVGC